MNTISAENALVASAAKLAQEFMGHLEREEQALRISMEVLRQVRAGLVGNDLKALTTGLERQAKAIHASAELEKARARLRHELARTLKIPFHTATLTALAERLPGSSRQRLTSHRDRLRLLAREADQLNRNNAALIRYCLDFFSRLLVHLTGGPGIVERYGPSGSPHAGMCGSFFQARG
jgi:FlgN protein